MIVLRQDDGVLLSSILPEAPRQISRLQCDSDPNPHVNGRARVCDMAQGPEPSFAKPDKTLPPLPWSATPAEGVYVARRAAHATAYPIHGFPRIRAPYRATQVRRRPQDRFQGRDQTARRHRADDRASAGKHVIRLRSRLQTAGCRSAATDRTRSLSASTAIRPLRASAPSSAPPARAALRLLASCVTSVARGPCLPEEHRPN